MKANKLIMVAAAFLFAFTLESCGKKEEIVITERNDKQETCRVTFKNYDDKTLYVVDVYKGTNCEYKGDTPTKPDTQDGTYEFIGWDKDLTNVTTNMIVYAQYRGTANGDYGPIYWAGEENNDGTEETV